jgi:hypothetical protein
MHLAAEAAAGDATAAETLSGDIRRRQVGDGLPIRRARAGHAAPSWKLCKVYIYCPRAALNAVEISEARRDGRSKRACSERC